MMCSWQSVWTRQVWREISDDSGCWNNVDLLSSRLEVVQTWGICYQRSERQQISVEGHRTKFGGETYFRTLSTLRKC